jgi:hypothetical protein
MTRERKPETVRRTRKAEIALAVGVPILGLLDHLIALNEGVSPSTRVGCSRPGLASSDF